MIYFPKLDSTHQDWPSSIVVSFCGTKGTRCVPCEEPKVIRVTTGCVNIEHELNASKKLTDSV